MSAVFFCVSVFLLNTLLFRSRLVPRWISGWALVAALPYLADSFVVFYDLAGESSPLHAALFAPLALNEMALAIWLLTRGFANSQRP